LALCAALLLLAWTWAPALLAQIPPIAIPPGAANGNGGPAANGNGGAPAEVEVAPDSPRASLRHYVELCRTGHFAEAARYLDLPPGKAVDGAGLARRLKAVLDRHMWLDVELASPLSSGNVADKLPVGVDELGLVPGLRAPEPVRLIRRPTAQGTIWVFTRATVDKIDVWYGLLNERWLIEALPEPLLRPGPFDILYWQYLALPLLVLVSWVVGRLLGYVTRKLIGKMVARSASRWDDTLLRRIRPPLTLAWGLAAFAIIVPRLGLYEPARDTVQKVIRAGFLIALFWSALRTVDVAKNHVIDASAPGRASARSLVPLGAQLVKVLVFCAAVVTVLSELGFAVTSLIAGLGIGGIALALAAQKTVENLFGSLSIGVDQPFRVGDFVKVEDVVGTVETVGLRSTRIRTLDRTLVTIPNGKLADMRIESFAVRDRFRLSFTLGLVYGTTAEQLRKVLAGVEAAMREEPTFFTEAFTVAVKGFGAFSIDVEVMAWFEVPTWDDFVPLRQRVLLRILEVVEASGTELAFPTQTLHMKGDAGGAAVVRGDGAGR